MLRTIKNVDLLSVNTNSQRQARKIEALTAKNTSSNSVEVWVTKSKSNTVVALLNTGDKAVAAPAISIGDVGFVPYINNVIQFTTNILSANKVVGAPKTVTNYDM